MRRAPGNQRPKKGSAARSSPPPGRSAIGGRACRAQAGRPGDGTRWDTGTRARSPAAQAGAAADRRSRRIRRYQRREAIVSTLQPLVLDRYVLALDIAEFSETRAAASARAAGRARRAATPPRLLGLR